MERLYKGYGSRIFNFHQMSINYHKTSRYAGNERVFRPEREATRAVRQAH